MRFGLMRHGVAEAGSAGQPDSERRLTVDGRRRLAQQAEWLISEGITFGQIVSSPLLRAQQTAAAVAARLGLEVTVDALLTSGCSPDDVVALLSRLKANQSPLLIGHQPDLSTTVAVLTERHISFAQGDLAILERSSDGYELLRHIPANEQLR